MEYSLQISACIMYIDGKGMLLQKLPGMSFLLTEPLPWEISQIQAAGGQMASL
ncbi:MAG: hypothetical protein ABRQ37_11300 [Candidatus Eremiobacterota bacterium]